MSLAPPRLYVQRGGCRDGLALVLIHGLGGSAGCWAPFTAAVEPSWPGPIVAVDLPGHGASEPLTEVGYEAMAAAVADAVAVVVDEAVVVGHSLGGVVALALGAGTGSLPVSRTLALGVRIRWTADDLEIARRRAARPAKILPSEEEARAYALKVAGLPAGLAADDPRAARLVRSDKHGYRAAFEPASSPAGSASQHPGDLVTQLVAQARAPVTLVRGENDPAVSLADLRGLDPAAVEIAGAGHAPHLDNPHAVADLTVCLSGQT